MTTEEIPLKWKRSDITEVVIDLANSEDVEHYEFNRDSSVAVTYGKKDSWLASPLMKWRVRNGILEIIKDDRSIFQRLRLIEKRDTEFLVENKLGKRAVYKLRK